MEEGIMSLEWTDDLILGIEEIDRQHRAMFERFKQISLACHGTETGQVLSHLTALENLIQQHFETEERLMNEFGYPAIAVQRSEHEQFAQNVGEVRRMADSQGPSRMLGARVADSMVQWIVRHIRQHDGDLARFIKLRQAV
jgi:hemerythrin